MIVEFYKGLEITAHPLIGLGFAVVVAVVTLVLMRIVRIIGRALEEGVDNRAAGMTGIRLQEQEILSGQDIAAFLTLVVRGLRLIVSAWVLITAVAFGCRLFSWTEHIAEAAVDLVFEVLWAVGRTIIDYIPNLLVIAVVGAILWYSIRLVHLVFMGIESQRIRIRGFYPEWAIPTFNIVKLLMVVFAIVVVFPYFPGAGSPAFKGVSIFLGVLVSLGSTSAVANVIAGVLLIYMRAFKVGDRVRISDIEGIVVERSLLVTRIRTPKNVEVAIPNAKVMAEPIINFNAQAKKKGLVHHTTLSIGYDVEWRRVRDLLIAAAAKVEGVGQKPEPFVRQLELRDFSVVYELNVNIHQPHLLPRITSDLHANILDAFNEAGVEIMSPEFAALRDGNALAIPRAAEGES
ncbi:MAG: mechanosensitive ion channel [Acidobacteria bacterium]|nr:mechanosensitive ion channel [Acidobacteriota bacterium]